MGASRLPQELIDAVTDNLHEDHGALLACSLVCRSWLPSSQRHLFRRVTFALDEDDCEQLAQALLNSPHLVNYILELEVCVDAEFWQAREGGQSLPAAVLCKLSKLRSIELCNLEMDKLTVDLRQSLRWVLRLPTLTSLTFRIGDSGDVDLLQDLVTRGDQEDDEPRERSYLSHLNLEFAEEVEGFGPCVDWFLGPRSPFEISHIQNLHLKYLDRKDEEALNRLFRTIGDSLKQVEFEVPYPLCDDGRPELKPAFDIKLEYNSSIRFLALTNFTIEEGVGTTDSGLGVAWLLRFLSNFDASNKIEQIVLQVIIVDPETFEEVSSAAGWSQVDCILAEKFRKLEELHIKVLVGYLRYYSEVEQVLNVHPMLDKRGVPVVFFCEEYPRARSIL